MLTYQVRPRIYRHSKGENISFPNDVELVFYFHPLQPFGKESGGGLTAVKAVAARILFDSNTGRHWIESKKPLKQLDVVIEEPVRVIEMRGNELHISTRFNSLNEMDEIVQSLFFAFPILLNIEFTDPPFVERVAGKVGGTNFRWELDGRRMDFETTTQELQEQRIALSWKRLDILSQQENRRVIAALHYFHVACRLSRTGNAPWEFMSEIIINLSKVLEVLFPPMNSDGKTLDSARSGLTGLKYTSAEIERNFLPAMALRNNIDSAHVDLSVFTREQLRVIHAYTEVAEITFRELLKRVLRGIETKHYTPAQYGEPGRRLAAEKIIDRIAKHCVSLDDMSKKQS